MAQSFLERDRLNEPVPLRMSERLVDKVDVDTLALVITIDRLQTGGVANEGGSCQTTEYDHSVSSFQFLLQGERISLFIETGYVGEFLSFE